MQWYPPVATIPPPPPPPPSNDISDKVEKTLTPDDSSKKEDTAESDFVKNSELTNNIISSTKSEERVTPIEEDSPALKKEKDKELMNQIKERIKRKKEEKLKKEQEEKKKLEKGTEDVSKTQKGKEETLREKLIKKKLERETKVDSKQNDNDLEPWNDFSVDIFATGTSGSKHERKNSETKADKLLAAKESKPSQNKISESDSTTSPINTLRLIDAGYDDDDDEDVEEDQSSEEKKDVVKEKTKKENVPQENTSIEKSEKITENNDNYADRLLEGNYKT